ncbi:aldose 1-epimerase [Oceanomicrobium pacificus]|uniref:Aldose 1-epimerase n=1 Tax=Oceanomicrobium pacificus TaxID=2692916 RepID=A0A6B0TRH3_9RHOB|nr:aldose 1-epimerase [Oceanomicrobium pacificus]MXU64405.1 aldose 1-epimerase [Oceanomicrobium pacificus]
MAALLELEDDRSKVALAPELGGAVAGMWAKTGGQAVPVLRSLAGAASFDLASNVLVPFSNRIGGGAFTFEGRTYDVAPNLEGEACPIHGDGFQRGWQVVQTSAAHAVLVLDKGDIGPWRYSARLDYRLSHGALSASLAVTNTGERLPFGGGFHPWLPRYQDTRLAFEAKTVWLQDVRYLPTEEVPAAGDWDYAQGRALPEGLINNAFCAWSGSACVEQPALGIDVAITSPLDTAIVYSPSSAADFFCFEPVSHPVDAHNMPELPGLTVLERGACLSLVMEINWAGRDA